MQHSHPLLFPHFINLPLFVSCFIRSNVFFQMDFFFFFFVHFEPIKISV